MVKRLQAPTEHYVMKKPKLIVLNISKRSWPRDITHPCVEEYGKGAREDKWQHIKELYDFQKAPW